MSFNMLMLRFVCCSPCSPLTAGHSSQESVKLWGYAGEEKVIEGERSWDPIQSQSSFSAATS